MKRKSGSTPGGFRSIQVQQRGLFVLTGKLRGETDELLGFAKGRNPGNYPIPPLQGKATKAPFFRRTWAL
ncbi:MAG: hypothetical protein ACKO0N_02405, partial [Planctomycetota bacterium]